MSGRIFLFTSLATVLLLANMMALAQGPVEPQHSDPTWQAVYWNNTFLSGSSVLQRSEAAIDYDWGNGSPDSSVNPDRFSARWSRYIDVPPGLYRFTATSDDGIRVRVDSDLIIDQWYDHPARTFTADKNLTAGHHLVVVEFYENGGNAVAKASWVQTQNIYNWRGEYYNNTTLSGSPALVRDDAQINFNWGDGSPAPGVVGADKFSARWTRTLDLSAGSYRFTLTVDDGSRLWVNNHLLIDTWQDQAPRTYTGEIYLPGGAIPIKLEYYENMGGAVVQLAWTSGGAPPTPPAGVVIVDDKDADFVTGGSSTGWRTAPEGYNGRLTWTRNNDVERPNYNWARWQPGLAPGRYEVYVFIPERYTTTSHAVYGVSHAGGFTQRVIDQSTNGNRWVSLGAYRFRGTRDDYISLNDITSEDRLTRLIAFDAVKWEPR
jgi:hypothetical protein